MILLVVASRVEVITIQGSNPVLYTCKNPLRMALVSELADLF